jgi:hypothetical protein
MRMTLLEIVQDILSAMDSDEVNSIGDSTEATQVATAVKHAYNDIVSRANLPEHFDLFELNASGDPLQPTIMYLPQDALNLIWLKYDKRSLGDTDAFWDRVEYLPQDEFVERVLSYQNQSVGDVVHFTVNGPNSSFIDIYGLNNKPPQFYTSFNDRMLIFDSFDQTIDTTLMKNKTLAYGELGKLFVMEDDFVPDLDPRQFALLYNEAKASCFADLKQMSNDRAERKVKQGWTTLQHQKSSIPARPRFYDTTPNYGRNSYYGRSRRRGYHD